MTYCRTYLPCDEWLYVRIYTGHRRADLVLSEVLFPLWQQLNKQGLSDCWFFIRFSDLDFHLRFRAKFKTNDAAYMFMEELNKTLSPQLEEALVWKIELGMYVPEKERYGEESMAFAEHIFCADSVAFSEAFRLGIIKSDEDYRWLFAMASIDHLLNDFSYMLDEKKSLLLELSRSFAKEFNKDKHMAKQISGKFRENRIRIKEIFEENSNENIHGIFRKRSQDSNKAIKAILGLYAEDKMTVPKNDLISSFIHMSMNRIFRNNNRMHEMIIYDLLFRYYKSMMFREQF